MKETYLQKFHFSLWMKKQIKNTLDQMEELESLALDACCFAAQECLSSNTLKLLHLILLKYCSRFVQFRLVTAGCWLCVVATENKQNLSSIRVLLAAVRGALFCTFNIYQ